VGHMGPARLDQRFCHSGTTGRCIAASATADKGKWAGPGGGWRALNTAFAEKGARSVPR
jgi:hypothetical protein